VTNHKTLRSLAERATQPGPWTVDTGCAPYLGARCVIDANGFWVADVDDAPHNAAYIAAASPDVVLALLDEVERLRGNAEIHMEVERKRVALIEQLNEQRFAWRNWADEVAPPFGSDRDRSDDGQRQFIKQQLSAMTAARDEARYQRDMWHAAYATLRDRMGSPRVRNSGYRYEYREIQEDAVSGAREFAEKAQASIDESDSLRKVGGTP
jgi:hypothetical protein